MAVEGIGHWPVEASKKRKTKDERTDMDGIAQDDLHDLEVEVGVMSE